MVPGFSWCGLNVGIKDSTLDLGVIFSEIPCHAAGVFTRNTMPGAPVLVGREHLMNGTLQAVIVNSKNANVATGQKGIDDSREICRMTGETLGISEKLVLPSSTGVIGRMLPMEKITKGLPRVKSALGSSPTHIEQFARAIMTTDTRPKWICRTVGKATIVGLAKGAGMIEPNMATMLSYFATDAKIPSETLSSILHRSVNRSFNRISIDSDTSTSDTVVVLANGKAGEVDLEKFEQVFCEMATYLAREIARDGEGATKLIELCVSKAETPKQALKIAKSVINSPLVKTAIYGADPNWGRFIMAIGKVFEYVVPIDKLRILFGRERNMWIDAHSLNQNTVPLAAISEYLKNSEIFIEIELGTGEYAEVVWGCDLTEGYIKENAYYTT
ncbi:MAG: bifunctional glutamate N-acetyltransferase/amino-acid acetyltransferase ArgJ [SAR324 cluster bacterium]|nr:bifunctional glutamate N-acetyltransferase/amino-acid acetyltransferase ArgJ [SAR324 cluster bacterium]